MSLRDQTVQVLLQNIDMKASWALEIDVFQMVTLLTRSQIAFQASTYKKANPNT